MARKVWSFPAIAVLAALSIVPAPATVKPMSMFSSHAALQRGIPIPVWGTARDGEKVSVTFKDQTISARATGGKWKVKLDPSDAGGPFVMTIAGEDSTIRLSNVMIGEVWVCGGQSNMHWWLRSESCPRSAFKRCQRRMAGRGTEDRSRFFGRRVFFRA